MNTAPPSIKLSRFFKMGAPIFVVLLLSLLLSCTQQLTPPPVPQPEFIQAKSLNGRGRIRILRESDIRQLKTGTTWNNLLEWFGEPFPTTLGMLTWPKQRAPLKDSHENSDSLWLNGYWFLFKDFLHEGGTAPLRIVVSFDKPRQLRAEESIPIQDMTINWPPELRGQNAGEFLMKWKRGI